MLYMEIIAIRYDRRTEHTQAHCRQNELR